MLRPQDYDAELVDELRAELRIAKQTPFVSGLSGCPAQTLVMALFKLVEPVAAMMTDLLRLCERIKSARGSEPNLRIRFDFDPESEPLEVDLSAFRDWEAVFRKAFVPRKFRRWNQDPAWSMVGAIDRGLVDDEEAEVARERPAGRPSWPPLGETGPRSGIPELDALIGRLWDLREEFLGVASGLWPERNDYRDGFHNPDLSVHALPVMVSDWWDEAMGGALEGLARRGAEKAERKASTADLAESITRLTREVDDLLAQLPAEVHPVEETVRDLISILSLPMWGKRHELYSAWIFARIVEAIGFDRLTFLTRSGRLSFDFSGAQLATFDTVDGIAHVWAELKTRHPNPIGHGRKAGIQPDYSLCFEPVSEADTSFLAIECKQYLRSALRNPAEAIADYTSGLPNAHVNLAAYGPISPRVLDRLDPASHARAAVLRYLRPGNRAEIDALHDFVSAHIPNSPPAQLARPADAPTLVFPRDGVVRVELTWTERGADLDLHARLKDGQVVNFQRLHGRTAAGSVELLGDVRDAPGPEVMLVSGEDPVVIAIQAFSAHDLGAAGGRLRIVSGGLEVIRTLTTTADAGARWYEAIVVRADCIESIERSSYHYPM